jgi:hypothetical protein
VLWLLDHFLSSKPLPKKGQRPWGHAQHKEACHIGCGVKNKF